MHSVRWCVSEAVFDIFAHLNYNKINHKQTNNMEWKLNSFSLDNKKKKQIKPIKVDGVKKQKKKIKTNHGRYFRSTSSTNWMIFLWRPSTLDLCCRATSKLHCFYDSFSLKIANFTKSAFFFSSFTHSYQFSFRYHKKTNDV